MNETAKQDIRFSALRQGAWQATKGMKGKIWLLFLYISLAQISLAFIFHGLESHYVALPGNKLWLLLQNLLTSFASAPFLGGCMMLALMRMRNQPVTCSTWVPYSKNFMGVGTVLFITALITNLPVYLYLGDITTGMKTTFLWVLLLGMMIQFLLIMAVLFVVDKQMSPIQACLASAKLVLRHFKVAISVFLFFYLLVVISVPLLFIPLVWVLPFNVLLIANLYAHLE
jgi:hypothetical protein